ncbi:YraN family protein [Neorhizobium galegae]|uniref:YraN family protein n=1 Tax=Neorhizobium galegae TaxID=399 RepID=UPI0006224497|nr:YraN family protein [Neorhizobium galegae]CDZ26345.1 Putative endonuclease related to Holliday junction resolvase [Neorhizobium galegae bv. officinalis]KAA9385692.1 YraN family protein [Neorhizobium galegae]KAB1112391.1 YraN family protein [Neorhizobium galegae]MCM2499665.1 YraN family protein [Neorhizobium galegae]MCQ1773023.1 YraN family protein [Neorhizobium galegae]
MAESDPGLKRRKVERQKAQRRGHVSEYLAALYLLVKGYRVLAIRYRTRLGEIDLIVRKGDLVAFVEVKARIGEQEAIDAVGYVTQNRIRAASDVWLSKRQDAARLSRRYDVIAVLPGHLPRHFANAF